MNARKLKKANKKRHLKIVSQLPFKISLHTFGSGYFIFDMGSNGVSWFWLEELPDWKFGIWLGKKNNFEIFGQATVLIDKFKPSYSAIARENDLSSFVMDVCKVIDRHPEWTEYLDDIIEANVSCNRQRTFEQEVFQIMFDTCKSLSTDSYHVRIEDRNTKRLSISPRYQIVESVDVIPGTDQTGRLTTDELIESINSFEVLCRSLSDLGEADVKEFSFRSIYIFTTLGQMVVSPEEYNMDAVKYQWVVETFDDHLKEIFDEQQDWKIDKDQLKYILCHWKKDNYPDSPTIPGFLDALKRCYDGQYNPWEAKKLVYGMFDYHRCYNWLTDYEQEKNK